MIHLNPNMLYQYLLCIPFTVMHISIWIAQGGDRPAYSWIKSKIDKMFSRYKIVAIIKANHYFSATIYAFKMYVNQTISLLLLQIKVSLTGKW